MIGASILGRRAEAIVGGEENARGHGEQHEPVHERGEDLGAVIAVSPAARRELPREEHGREREEEGEEVAEHVHGVGEEGERARDVPADHLHGEDDERDQDRGPERRGHGPVLVTVAVRGVLVLVHEGVVLL